MDIKTKKLIAKHLKKKDVIARLMIQTTDNVWDLSKPNKTSRALHDICVKANEYKNLVNPDSWKFDYLNRLEGKVRGRVGWPATIQCRVLSNSENIIVTFQGTDAWQDWW